MKSVTLKKKKKKNEFNRRARGVERSGKIGICHLITVARTQHRAKLNVPSTIIKVGNQQRRYFDTEGNSCQ